MSLLFQDNFKIREREIIEKTRCECEAAARLEIDKLQQTHDDEVYKLQQQLVPLVFVVANTFSIAYCFLFETELVGFLSIFTIMPIMLRKQIKVENELIQLSYSPSPVMTLINLENQS